MHFTLCILMTVLALASPATPEKTREQMKASFDAHRGDFDYLIGDWDFTAVSQQYGKFRGHWSASRLGDGAVLDEYRVLGDGGETIYATRTVRAFNETVGSYEARVMRRSMGARLDRSRQRPSKPRHRPSRRNGDAHRAAVRLR